MARSVSVRIARDTSLPLYQQIAEQLAHQINSGEIAPETRLPAIRLLADELQVNTATVVRAYQELKQAGLAVSRTGSGTYVVGSIPVQQNEEKHLPLTLLDQGQVEIPAGAINFASATPDPDVLPVGIVQRLINKVIERDGGDAFAYEDSRGYPPLREAVAVTLKQIGIEASTDSIQVISGAQQGIDIVAKSLIDPGDTVLVEQPTYPGALAAFRSRGAHILSVPLQNDGPDLDVLEQTLHTSQPQFFYLMSAFQNPTGIVYSRDKKEKLLQLAARFRLTILEDDYLRELTFNEVDLTPLAAIAPTEVPILYLKSFSKVLLPGLRLAFLVVPPAVSKEVLTAKHASDIFTSGLFQRVFELLIREGIWEEQLAKVRDLYRERYLALSAALHQHLPETISFDLPAGGLNFWLRLPGKKDAFELYKEALQEGVVIAPGSAFSCTGGLSPYFRLTYASCSPEEIERGVTLLATAVRRLLGESPKPDYMPFV